MEPTFHAYHGVSKIISGGQTGVDRAALDVAIDLGMRHGGWCPKGRLAEDGPIDERYQLQEMSSRDYTVRTEQNVIDSDGTLVLYRERLQGGTLLTYRFTKVHSKPVHRVRLDRPVDYARIVQWIAQHRIQTLNVAGPRRSSCPTLETTAKAVLRNLFRSTSQLPLIEE